MRISEPIALSLEDVDLKLGILTIRNSKFGKSRLIPVRTLINWYRKGADVEQRLPELATYFGHKHVNDTYWYLRRPRAPSVGYRTIGKMRRRIIAMKTTATFPALLESFFTERLMKQRRVSPETIASYRDTFSLFLNFAQKHLHEPSNLRPYEKNTHELFGIGSTFHGGKKKKVQ